MANRNRRNNNQKSRRNYDQAWAPYNFVPLQDSSHVIESETQDHDSYEGLSGYFDVELVTESPTYIRGMLTPDEKRAGKEAKDKSEFFSIDGITPIIPGSSLRGMLRNLLEIVSFGKVHFVSDKYLVYRSVFGSDPLAQDYRQMVTEELGRNYFMYPSRNLNGGYLVRDADSESGWAIQPAQRYEDESFILVDRWTVEDAGIKTKLLQVKQVWLRPAARETYTNRRRLQLEVAQTKQISEQPLNSYVPAKLVIAGQAPKRHWHTAIYDMDEDCILIPISKQLWDSWMSDRDLQRGIDNRKIEKEGDPLFYVMQGGKLVFFGPTMFFRVPYENSIVDMIPKALRNPYTTDFADAIFGFVSEDENSENAYAGRVSVTSAHVTPGQSDFYLDEIPLKILGTPKPTTFQHYLEQPYGADTDENDLLHFNNDTVIRGHKLYWRQETTLDDVKGTDDPSKKNVTTRVKPLRDGVTFKFKVHFDNLTDAELGVLAWVLTLGQDVDARHQIGMGKPLGMGIVKLDATLTIINREHRYEQLFDENGKWFSGDEPITNEEISAVISVFKDMIEAKTGSPFDQHNRIIELRTLLRKQTRREDFSYMSIDTKDYSGRPVLPRPSEIN